MSSQSDVPCIVCYYYPDNKCTSLNPHFKSEMTKISNHPAYTASIQDLVNKKVAMFKKPKKPCNIKRHRTNCRMLNFELMQASRVPDNEEEINKLLQKQQHYFRINGLITEYSYDLDSYNYIKKCMKEFSK